MFAIIGSAGRLVFRFFLQALLVEQVEVNRLQVEVGEAGAADGVADGFSRVGVEEGRAVNVERVVQLRIRQAADFKDAALCDFHQIDDALAIFGGNGQAQFDVVVVVFRQFADFVGNAKADFRAEFLLEDFRRVRYFDGHIAGVEFADVEDDGGLLFFAHGILLLSMEAMGDAAQAASRFDLRAPLYGFK